MSLPPSQNLDGVGRKEAAPFERIDHYERLIVLRETSPDAFMLRTSEAARRALAYYERAKAASLGCPMAPL